MFVPDILIHVHPDLSAQGRAEIENAVEGCTGVIAADFDYRNPHALAVLYNSDAVKGEQILAAARKFDSKATMVWL